MCFPCFSKPDWLPPTVFEAWQPPPSALWSASHRGPRWLWGSSQCFLPDLHSAACSESHCSSQQREKWLKTCKLWALVGIHLYIISTKGHIWRSDPPSHRTYLLSLWSQSFHPDCPLAAMLTQSLCKEWRPASFWWLAHPSQLQLEVQCWQKNTIKNFSLKVSQKVVWARVFRPKTITDCWFQAFEQESVTVRWV